MKLTFSEREGHREAFERNLVIEAADGRLLSFRLKMHSEPRPPIVYPDGYTRQVSVRVGTITNSENAVVWTGDLPGDANAGPPPTRAFALAAGLCDENGDSQNMPLPSWAE